MGVLPSFAGIAVHDAWAPYDTYAPAGHQLCCAHALRELQAVTDSAPAGQWCWAAQAADALTGMQVLVSEAITQGRDAADPAALAALAHRYRSAVLLGARQTAARSGTLMRKHHALACRLRDRQEDYLRFTTDWRIPADNDPASHCTSRGCCAVSGLAWWSWCLGARIVACASDISGAAGGSVGVAAA
jgi:transposase